MNADDNENLASKRLRSILQCDLIVEGSIKGEGILEVDGKIVGNIDVDTVVATNNGVIVGDIRTRNLTVIGQVTGSIECDALVLKESANVVAETIRSSSIAVESGAWIHGEKIQVK